jgi:hypothetical protein
MAFEGRLSLFLDSSRWSARPALPCIVHELFRLGRERVEEGRWTMDDNMVLRLRLRLDYDETSPLCEDHLLKCMTKVL